MRIVSMVVAFALAASPALAQDRPAPIRASIDQAVAAALSTSAGATNATPSGHRSTLFWTGLAVSLAGVTTSALGLTALRTDQTSTGNAPDGTYLACVAQRDSNPIYATNQCDALKGKNLKALWGGVAIAGAGLGMMIGGSRTSAEVSGGGFSVFHRVRF